MSLSASPVASTMVDPAVPLSLPPSMRRLIEPLKYPATSSAVTGGFSPDGFALVEVIGKPRALENLLALGQPGSLTPIVPVPAVTEAGSESAAFSTIVRGPGQKRFMSLTA